MSHPNITYLLNKILDYVHTGSITIDTHPETNNTYIVINEHIVLTILETNTWEEVKKRIDVNMASNPYHTCAMCQNQHLCKLTCTKCAIDWCRDCYIRIFRKGKGIVKCPFCSHTNGRKLSPREIEDGVRQISSKLKY